MYDQLGENAEEEIYLKKLEAGLSILQSVDFILGFLLTCRDKDVIGSFLDNPSR